MELQSYSFIFSIQVHRMEHCAWWDVIKTIQIATLIVQLLLLVFKSSNQEAVSLYMQCNDKIVCTMTLSYLHIARSFLALEYLSLRMKKKELIDSSDEIMMVKIWVQIFANKGFLP